MYIATHPKRTHEIICMTSKKQGRIFLIQEKNHMRFCEHSTSPPPCLPVICYAVGRKSASAVRSDQSFPLILPLLGEKSTLPLNYYPFCFHGEAKKSSSEKSGRLGKAESKVIQVTSRVHAVLATPRFGLMCDHLSLL